MTRQANILSFDEVKAREAGSPRVVSGRSSHRRASSHSFSGESAPNTTASRTHSASSERRNSPSFATASVASSPRAHSRRGTHASSDTVSSRSSTAVWEHSRARGRAAQVAREEEDAAETPRRSSARRQNEGMIKDIRKRFRARKAERAFDRQIGSKEKSAAPEQASRAALYEMRMGSTHKKSSRMQDAERNGAKGRGFALPFSFSFLQSVPSFATKGLAVAFVAVFACFMLYPSCASYYNQVRQLQQLQAEYAALEAYNEEMQAQVDYLSTDEGLEDYARSELGWIRSDEHMVTVEGVSTTSDDTEGDDTLYLIAEGAVEAPDTWYSGVLDVVFGYGS